MTESNTQLRVRIWNAVSLLSGVRWGQTVIFFIDRASGLVSILQYHRDGSPYITDVLDRPSLCTFSLSLYLSLSRCFEPSNNFLGRLISSTRLWTCPENSSGFLWRRKSNTHYVVSNRSSIVRNIRQPRFIYTTASKKKLDRRVFLL